MLRKKQNDVKQHSNTNYKEFSKAALFREINSVQKAMAEGPLD